MGIDLTKLCFVEIDYGSVLYRSELNLRSRFLRAPLGLNLSEADLLDEDRQFHFGLLEDNELIGCVVIKPVDKDLVKLRQMIVRPDFQGVGVGSMLLQRTERVIAQKSFNEINLNARISAVIFYSKHGYIQQGLAFIEVGIPHLFMYKNFNKLNSKR